jgi:hypothetical protein
VQVVVVWAEADIKVPEAQATHVLAATFKEKFGLHLVQFVATPLPHAAQLASHVWVQVVYVWKSNKLKRPSSHGSHVFTLNLKSLLHFVQTVGEPVQAEQIVLHVRHVVLVWAPATL